MSAALKAAVRDAGDRLDAYRRFAERSLELLNAGITPPRAGEDAKLYRQLALSALRLLTKFPRALIKSAEIGSYARNPEARSLAKVAHQFCFALQHGLIGPGEVLGFQLDLHSAYEPEPERPRSRKSPAVVLPALPAAVRNAREPLMLPERAGGVTLGQLGLNLPEDP